MRAVNIRELKNNPSEALRSAREDDLVVVMNRDQPQALLVDLTRLKLPDMASVKVALAVALFGQGNVSLGYAARIVPCVGSISRLTRLAPAISATRRS